MGKKKFYVVWQGRETGVFNKWKDCKKNTDGVAAKFKSFETEDEANKAYKAGWENHIIRKPKKNVIFNSEDIIAESMSVDAACSGNPGAMEYRGVYTKTKKEVFKMGVFKNGTNNIGEFLALVHGLALLKQKNSDLPIYSDSKIAIGWIAGKKCRTKLPKTEKNKDVFDLVKRAELWLKNNTFTTKIYKWETKQWGEIPADFGRK
ncbi:MAG: viroplasmin family protein [Flavobacteriaceae bacterium]|nr:viroplasmin family protein [Flavobacteriaceae bacterium]